MGQRGKRLIAGAAFVAMLGCNSTSVPTEVVPIEAPRPAPEASPEHRLKVYRPVASEAPSAQPATPAPQAPPVYSGVVEGAVTGPGGEPIAGAKVTLRQGALEGFQTTTTTGPEGTFEVTDVPPHTPVVVEVDAPKYQPETVSLVSFPGHAEVEVALAPLVMEPPHSGLWELSWKEKGKRVPGPPETVSERVELVFEPDGRLRVAGREAARGWAEGRVSFAYLVANNPLSALVNRQRTLEFSLSATSRTALAGTLTVEEGGPALSYPTDGKVQGRWLGAEAEAETSEKKNKGKGHGAHRGK